jgi:HlyD family secretion protein
MKIGVRSVALRRMALALLVVPVAAVGSWRFLHQDSAPSDVAIVQALQRDLLSAVTATGTVEARRTVDIKYDSQSLIVGLFVKEGDHVAAGQTVATMDLSLLEPALAQSRQTLQKDQASLLLAEASLKRSEALAAAQVLAQADLDSARANFEGLLHLTRADEGAVAQAEEQIHRASLRSPINGIAIALYVHIGEMLGSATAVAGFGPNAAVSKPTNTLRTIAEQGDLEVDADVNAVDMGEVMTGQKANFTIDAFQPEVFSGTVRSIALQPTVTNGVTTYRVVLSIPRPDRRFRIGMPTNVMLFRTVAKDAILVPPTAVLKANRGSSVFAFSHENQPANLSGRGFNADRDQLSVLAVRKGKVVQCLGETSSAVAVTGDIKPGDWILLNASLAATGTNTANPIEAAFKPNPDPSDLQFERTAHSLDQKTSTTPGPKPKGFLQRLFNP